LQNKFEKSKFGSVFFGSLLIHAIAQVSKFLSLRLYWLTLEVQGKDGPLREVDWDQYLALQLKPAW
jgi:hypothetical protein